MADATAVVELGATAVGSVGRAKREAKPSAVVGHLAPPCPMRLEMHVCMFELCTFCVFSQCNSVSVAEMAGELKVEVPH